MEHDFVSEATMIVPTTSLAGAQAFSRALYKLSRPNNPSDTTLYYCGWLEHPVTSAPAINIPMDPLPVAVDADPHQLDAIFQPFIDAGQMNASELTALQTAITANRGERVVPLQFLALLPSFAATALTDEQAEAAGWFATEEEG